MGEELYPVKTTLELGAEKKIAEAKAKTIVLAALEDVKVSSEEKRLGFLKIGKTRVENYEEFIERLGNYAKIADQPISPEQVYRDLKDLEKAWKGSLKRRLEP
ncbi:MAG: hypothetical protein FGF50_11945 [Candidatus Brockarchaeota archaeon]|nr:hypothetical protein [Candidatus Brockarchaeota archaeon]